MSDINNETANHNQADAGFEILTALERDLGGGMIVRRALPNKQRRRVSAWCFFDHFGPVPIDRTPGQAGMRVGPHPHIGLQTVTWLLAGEVEHKDSLGSHCIIRPGQLNLMTAGRGIVHSEETPVEHTPLLHGLQFWIALPDAERHRDPAFEHHETLPTFTEQGDVFTLVIGNYRDQQSPATVFGDLLGLDLDLAPARERALSLEPQHEHAIMLLQGSASIDGTALDIGKLYFFGTGRDRLLIRSDTQARAFLFGGEPMSEQLILWWNFVARSHEEIETARADWIADRFGSVDNYDGDRLIVPPLTQRLKAS